MDVRDAWQDEAIRAWNDAFGQGTVVAGTGTGKTYLAIKIIKKIEDKFGEKEIHIVVPKRPLKKQWEDLLKLFSLDYVQVFVINTYVKEDRKCFLKVIDEAHRAPAPSFKKSLKTTSDYVLCLTATVKRKDGMHVYLLAKAPVVYTLSLVEARRLGLVSDYKFFNLAIPFPTEEEKDAYKRAHQGFNGLYKLFGHNFDRAMNCVKGFHEDIEHVAKEMELTHAEVRGKAMMWLRLMQKRQSILQNSQNKIPFIIELTQQVQGQIIIYTQTIEFAEKIQEALPGSKTYHTKIKGTVIDDKKIGAEKHKELILEQFHNAEFDILIAVKGLNEGISVPAVKLIIMASYDSGEINLVQRMGRGIRLDGDKVAIIVALYMESFKDDQETIYSKEKGWLTQAQKAEIGTVRWVTKVQDIFNERRVSL